MKWNEIEYKNANVVYRTEVYRISIYSKLFIMIMRIMIEIVFKKRQLCIYMYMTRQCSNIYMYVYNIYMINLAKYNRWKKKKNLKLFYVFLNKRTYIYIWKRTCKKNEEEEEDDDKCKCRIGLKPIESA